MYTRILDGHETLADLENNWDTISVGTVIYINHYYLTFINRISKLSMNKMYELLQNIHS